MLHKMMMRFDISDEHIKDLSSDLSGIGQKVDTDAISIKQLELQMAQLSATMTTRQSGTVRRNTVQNLKNGHCMAITTWGGKKTINPPMPSNEEKVIIDNHKVVEVSGEVEDNTRKDVEVVKKVTPFLDSPFPQRLVKKTEDGKYRHFITMLKQLSINVPLV